MALAGKMQTLVRNDATGNALTQQQQTFYAALALKTLLPYLNLLNEGEKATVPRRSGAGFHSGSIVFRKRATVLAAATTALTEGIPPDFQDIGYSTFSTQLAQYGAAMKHSDILMHDGVDDVIADMVAALGEQAGLTVHTLLMNVLAGGTTVQYANGRTARNTVIATDRLTAADVRSAGRTLALNNVPTYPDGTYHALVHTRQGFDLMLDPEWRELNGLNYAGQNGMVTADAGQVYGVKLQMSNVAPKFAGAGGGAADVYGALVYGPQAWGTFDFAAWPVGNLDPNTGKGIEIMMVPADVPSRDDPLGQFGTLGWKLAFTALILDQARLVRVETGATA